jgi:hypothetical protein
MTKSYKGVNAAIYIPEVSSTYPCAYAETASVSIKTNLAPAFTLGSAKPAVVTAGNIDISGSLSGYWIDVDLMNLMDRDACWAMQNEFSIRFYSNQCDASGAPVLYVSGCRADGLSFDFSQDGFLMHTLDFICTDWSYATYGA